MPRACGAQASIGPNRLMEPFICVGVSKRNPKIRRCAMEMALEVNLALRIMNGCGIAEYLS